MEDLLISKTTGKKLTKAALQRWVDQIRLDPKPVVAFDTHSIVRDVQFNASHLLVVFEIQAYLYEYATGTTKPVGERFGDHGATYSCGRFSRDGSRIALSTSQGFAVYETNTQKQLLAEKAYVTDCALFSPDGESLAVQFFDGIQIRNAQSGALLHAVPPEEEAATSMVFAPDTYSLLINQNFHFTRWDLSTQTATKEFGEGIRAEAFAFAEDVMITHDGSDGAAIDLTSHEVLWKSKGRTARSPMGGRSPTIKSLLPLSGVPLVAMPNGTWELQFVLQSNGKALKAWEPKIALPSYGIEFIVPYQDGYMVGSTQPGPLSFYKLSMPDLP
jgi:hypothetical protein